MKNNDEKIKAYLSAKPVNYGSEEIGSMLELLRFWYLEENPVDNADIRNGFLELDQVLDKLEIQDQNRVFMLTASLCTDHLKQAFSDGLHAGMRLCLELFT